MGNLEAMNTRPKMKATDWQKTFIGDPPCMQTIKTWIKNGELEGAIVGTTAFVYIDTNDTGETLLEKIVNDSKAA